MAGTWFDTKRNEGEVDGRYTRDHNEYLRWGGSPGAVTGDGSGSGQGGGYASIPAFNFDYDQAEKEALEKLRPYYEQKLKEAEGDIERAKKLIEEDYQRGLRYNEEDLTTSLAEDSQTALQETREKREDLNKRGLLFGEQTTATQSAAPVSQFANAMELNPLSQKQEQRRLAIQRAIQRQNEVAGIERTRGIEEQDIALPRVRRDLEEEKRRRAVSEFVPAQYNRALQKYNEAYQNNSTNPYLQRA